MKLIKVLLGDDTKILTKDEELINYFTEEYENARNKDEQLSWDTEYKNTWFSIHENKTILDQIKKIPNKVRIARKNILQNNKPLSGVVTFAKKNNTCIFSYSDNVLNPILIDPQLALNYFKCFTEEEAFPTSSNFYPIYEQVKQCLDKHKNTSISIESRGNIGKALDKLEKLSHKDKFLCEDIIRIMKEYDGFPEGIIREIANLDIKDEDKAIEKLNVLLPITYLESLLNTAQKADNSHGKIIVLSEEFI